VTHWWPHLPEANGHQDEGLDDRPPQHPLVGTLARLPEALLPILEHSVKTSALQSLLHLHFKTPILSHVFGSLLLSFYLIFLYCVLMVINLKTQASSHTS